MSDRISNDSLVFERLLDAPRERVWQFIVDPDLRGRWFMAAPGDIRPGGVIGLTMDHDRLSDAPVGMPEQYRPFVGRSWTERVSILEPPERIVFTWEDGAAGTVDIRLHADGGRTRLVLTHSGLRGRADAINFGGGWHAHLAVLARRVSGAPVADFWALHAEGEHAVIAALDARE